MTVEEKMIQLLVNKGMFESQAKQVLESAKIHKLFKETDTKWDSPSSGYPDSCLVVISMSIDMIALEWIDRNCPKAWFRPMFDSKQMKEIEATKA